MILLAQRAFSTPDWIVLASYLALLVGTGYVFSRHKPKSAEEYFVGERRMPVWAVAISILATALSAATFIGAPVESYTGDLTYLSATIGGIIAVFVVGWFFIPAFYANNVTTVYQLLERRFGRTSRQAASAAFMVGRIFASGARLYMAAIPLTMILFGDIDSDPLHLIVAIAILTAAGSLYTIVGGIHSIIWTDVVQTIVFVGAAIAAVLVLLYRIPLSIPDLYTQLASTPAPDGPGSKLTLFRLGINPKEPGLGLNLSQAYTLLTAMTGFALLNIAAYGADQDLVQRMLTCKSAAKGGRSAIVAVLIGTPITALFLVIGLLLYVFNLRPDIMGAPPPYPIAEFIKVFPQFILNQMPPGLSGLFMAGLFAVALTSLMSALNAMSSTFVTDFYRQIVRERSDRHYLAVGRLGVLLWGVILGLFACLCVYWQRHEGQTLIKFALGVMSFAYAGLLGVFFTALFTRRGNNTSVIAALVVGFLFVLAFQPFAWTWLTDCHPALQATPDDLRFTLGDLKLAFPWQLTIASAAAFGVCVSGRARTMGSGDAPASAGA